jgi:hypothetical protein
LTSATPKISGAEKVGKKLSYQWLRNGKAIKGATKSVDKADKGKKVTVSVQGSKKVV